MRGGFSDSRVADDRDAALDRRTLIGGTILFGILAALVSFADRWVVTRFNLPQASPLRPFFEWLDDPAPRWSMTVAVLAGVMLMALGRRAASAQRSGLVIVIGFWVVLVITHGLKSTVGRARPMLDVGDASFLWSPLGLADLESFPSGHVSSATAIASALWLAAGRGRVRNLLWAFPLLQCIQRVVLAAHWPSDVLAGVATGLLGTTLTAWITRWPVWAGFLRALDPDRGRPFCRPLFFLGAWLILTRVWIALPVGRDPVSGEIVPGFDTRPQLLRVITEPISGPVLWSATEADLASFFRWALCWGCGLVLLLVLSAFRSKRGTAIRAALAIVVAGSLWAVTFWRGIAPPDAFASRVLTGVFVDWHLHGGDPSDGHIDAPALESRQLQRGVTWAVTTHHSHLAPDDGGLSAGVSGCEWSGRGPMTTRHAGTWDTPHLLVLGTRDAVAATILEAEPLAAVRAAKRMGAFVIVAHHWLTAGQVATPSVEAYLAAGVDGFEVGNRQRQPQSGDDARRLVDLDRACRAAGVWRVSFSDDHGIPAGSPCVTFLAGITEADLRRTGGLRVIGSIQKAGGTPDSRPGGIELRPLLFDPAPSRADSPGWFRPPRSIWGYFCSLRAAQRLSWFLGGGLAILWIFGVRIPRSRSGAAGWAD